MKHFTVLRVLSVAISFVLICLTSDRLCSAQGMGIQAQVGSSSIQIPTPGLLKQPQRKGHDRAREVTLDLIQHRLNTPIAGDQPITVYPDGISFVNLKEAFEFCSQNRSRGKEGSRQLLCILLQPGIYVGNFTLPPDTVGFVGRS